MTIVRRAFNQAKWLVVFKFFSQVLSWVSTIYVARLLMPADYGLMAMATMLTGYAALFSELGLGAAIIQQPTVTKKNLSSVFWFALGVSLLFSIICYFLSYPTSYLFNEVRIVPITQAVSIIFILNGLQIVPINLIKKRLKFKVLGIIEMVASVTSCICMVFLASQGAGVWTLLTGYIVRSLTKLTLSFCFSRWIPSMYFSFSQVKYYLGFGLFVSVGRTFNYIFEKSDKFFAGRLWESSILGYYTFAFQLAQIPTEKIVSLINQVSFPVFSELQFDKFEFNQFYLKVTKITAVFVLPLFVGGYLCGEELIRSLLNDKWIPIIYIFKLLCLSQIFMALTAINTMLHVAQGRPQWSMYFRGVCALFVGGSFYFAAQHGLNAMLIPWFTIYPLLCIGFIIISVRKLGIGVVEYISNLMIPFIATFCMFLAVVFLDFVSTPFLKDLYSNAFILIIKISIGGIVYLSAISLLDFKYFKFVINIFINREV